jgi:purine-binding chemotaxis protein CheW
MSKEQNENVTTHQFLTFSVDEEQYAVDIVAVREIKVWTQTTRLPNTPIFMRGVINLRGLIIPVFDLRARFNLGVTEANNKNVIIILSFENRTMGILVDKVSDIVEVTSDEIKQAPASEADIRDQCVNGLIAHNEEMLVLLSVDKLFDAELIANVIALSKIAA